ncbi:hypothetical protein RB195_007539 [Necator americanus]|uniref:Fibronectin type-III domain-containing protein n=1 Tax=Necator americanus TaxID=51031 RepID=A0ABR1C080_NECAM
MSKTRIELVSGTLVKVNGDELAVVLGPAGKLLQCMENLSVVFVLRGISVSDVHFNSESSMRCGILLFVWIIAKTQGYQGSITDFIISKFGNDALLTWDITKSADAGSEDTAYFIQVERFINGTWEVTDQIFGVSTPFASVPITPSQKYKFLVCIDHEGSRYSCEEKEFSVDPLEGSSLKNIRMEFTSTSIPIIRFSFSSEDEAECEAFLCTNPLIGRECKREAAEITLDKVIFDEMLREHAKFYTTIGCFSSTGMYPRSPWIMFVVPELFTTFLPKKMHALVSVHLKRCNSNILNTNRK